MVRSGSLRVVLSVARHWSVWFPVMVVNVAIISAVAFSLRGQPMGWFHKNDIARMKQRDAEERKRSEEVLKRGVHTKDYNDSTCILILTSKRKFVSGYLLRTVTTVDRNLGSHRPRIFIYNADTFTNQGADADRPEIIAGFRIVRPNKFPQDNNLHHRESFHYGHMLQLARAENCSWSVVLEDDVKPTSDFMPKLMKLVGEIRSPCDVGFIKLFDVDNLKGWSVYNVTDIVFLLASSSAVAFFIRFLCKRVFQSLANLPLAVHSFLLLQWGIAAFLLLGIVGKQRVTWLVKPRGLHEVGYWGDYVGGTQGTVFPQCSVGLFADYLLANWEGKNSTIDNAVDQLLPMAARQRGLRMYSTMPNLVQHIGLFSSHSETQDFISPVFSISFEE